MSVARVSRTLIGTAVLGALIAPALVVANSGGISLAGTKSVPAAQRKASPPNVMFPVASKKAKDLKTYGSKPGTEIKAPCGSTVRSAFAGVATVSKSKTSGKHLVMVTSKKSKIIGYYGFMRSHSVKTGQKVKSGQKLGTVGNQGIARFCSLYFALTTNATKTDPTRWLDTYVGKALPTSTPTTPTTPPELDPGFVVAAFNVLGASHTTKKGGRYPGYAWRTPRQVTFLAGYGLDVIGLQEFQKKNRTAFLKAAGTTYGIYPSDPKADTENSIIWRNSTMELVSASTINVPYFDGHPRKMPVIELRQKSTGISAYFINVHNPASIKAYGKQGKWRDKAIAIERAKVIELRKTGKAVFLTGDLNDRERAYCPLSAGGLMYSANTTPSTGACKMPKKASIDWVLVSGARFSSYLQDWSGKDKRLTDHPIIVSRAHLS
ncbi:hypothetical protein ABIE44_001052 [Marmoricola sp. OAE513]|uniref:peptidoglycan DD-metalloendopeptidase family protein n=1 Tax=Marmoricola sp. OAE513 TaxID=2817894 RepID=UPI001AE9A279